MRHRMRHWDTRRSGRSARLFELARQHDLLRAERKVAGAHSSWLRAVRVPARAGRGGLYRLPLQRRPRRHDARPARVPGETGGADDHHGGPSISAEPAWYARAQALKRELQEDLGFAETLQWGEELLRQELAAIEMENDLEFGEGDRGLLAEAKAARSGVHAKSRRRRSASS